MSMNKQESMSSDDLIDHILRLYREAEATGSGFEHDDITRGRRHTISSFVEDAVAVYLLKRLADPSLEVWVGYSLSYDYPGMAKRPNMYPDIAFVRREGAHIKLLAIVDVKMDLGFRRNEYEGKLSEIAEKVGKLKAARLVQRRVRVGDAWSDKKVYEAITVSPDLLCCIAVMSDQNMGRGDTFQAIRNEVSRYATELRLYTFTTGDKYLGYAQRDEVDILDNEIEALIQTLNSITAAHSA